MAMSDEDIDDLKKLLKKAKQKPLPYGLCLGKKPEDNVLFLDLKKSSEVMMRKAKAEGETGKLTHGEASVSGKILTLMVAGKMLPGLAKNMKNFMKKQDMKMKIVITDPSGAELESDGDEDIEDEIQADDRKDADTGTEQKTDATEALSQDATDAKPEGGGLMGQWAKASAAMDPFVTRFAASGHDKAAAVSAAWTGAGKAAEKGDYKSALAVAAKIKPLVMTASDAKAASTQEKPETTDPAAAKWASTAAALEALYTKAMANNPANRSKLDAAWGMAVEKAEAGDFKAAQTIADRLKPALEAAAAPDAKDTPSEVPQGVVAFQKSRILWIDTRKAMKAEMEKLQGAITQACSGDPELEPVIAEVGTLIDRLDVFDTSLEDILDKITVTPEGAERTKLKGEARDAIRAYAAALQDPFFKDVDGNNGFVNVSVASAATKSLSEIAKTIAA